MRMKIVLITLMMYPFWVSAELPSCHENFRLLGRKLGLVDCQTYEEKNAKERVAQETLTRKCKAKPGDCTLDDACPSPNVFAGEATANAVREHRECVDRWKAIADPSGRSR